MRYIVRLIIPYMIPYTTMFKNKKTQEILMIKESDELKKTILKTILKNQIPISTQDISNKLQKPWHSVQTRCLKLQIDNKIMGFRVGRINLWQIKK